MKWNKCKSSLMSFSPKLTAMYLFIQSKILSFWLHNVKLHA